MRWFMRKVGQEDHYPENILGAVVQGLFSLQGRELYPEKSKLDFNLDLKKKSYIGIPQNLGSKSALNR